MPDPEMAELASRRAAELILLGQRWGRRDLECQIGDIDGRRGDKDVYGNPTFGGLYQITGNSNSTGGFWGTYRVIAAKARARLVAAAAPSSADLGPIQLLGRFSTLRA